MADELYLIEGEGLPPELVTAVNAAVTLIRSLQRRVAELETAAGPGRVHGFARAGPEGIPGADYTDPAHPVPAEGDAVLLVDRDAGPMGDAGPIRLRNPWRGAIEPDWQPILIVRVDGRWSIGQAECAP
jgi:hypothetical protein